MDPFRTITVFEAFIGIDTPFNNGGGGANLTSKQLLKGLSVCLKK